MTIVGVLLLMGAVVGFFFMRWMRGQLHAMIAAETLPVNELEALRSASDEVGNRGGFRKQCEVVGAAYPRPEGLLVSELSKTECVWYRYKVERQYEKHEWRDGRRHSRRATETVAERTSWEGYALRDDQSRLIGVDPNGASPDRPEQVVDRFEPHQPQGPTVFGLQLPAIFDPNNTIGYRYKEWVIRPGARLYILGEVHDKIGPLVIAKPEQEGHFLISTRTEEELRKDRRQLHLILKIAVLAAAPIGLVLLVLGLILHK